MRLAFRAALASAAVMGWAAPSWAQHDAAAAEALFREGKRLLDANDLNGACPKFAESFRLDPATGTLLALAICHEEQGKLATAWSEYADVAARARREGRPDREEAARQKASALEPQLSYLTITVPAEVASTPGLQIRRDGVLLHQASFGTATPVDPGEHVVEATAEGKVPWKQNATVGKNADKKTVLVPPLTDAPAEAVAPPLEEATVPPDEAAPGESPVASEEGGTDIKQTLRLAGLITGGVGVVGLGIGGYFGLHAKSKLDESNEKGCEGNFCRGEGTALREDAVTAGNVSTAMFIVGGVLAAGGATLFILGLPSKEDAQPVAVRATPMVGFDSVGVSLAGGF